MDKVNELVHEELHTAINQLWGAVYSLSNVITFDDNSDQVIKSVQCLDAELYGLRVLCEHLKTTVRVE